MNLNKNISRLISFILFIVINQALLAQTWEEIDMHFPPGDSIEAKFSNLTTFTNQDTGWLTTGWAEKNE